MSVVEGLARFVTSASVESMSAAAIQALEIRILDAISCGAGALGSDVPCRVRSQIDELGGEPLCSLMGGGKTSPDRAALYNGTLVRYLDFNDSYLAPSETCHPSDNLAPVLAAAEHAGGSGADLLAALAVAYQVQCRLSDVAPVRDRGFDHTTQGAYAVAAGVARALRLDVEQTAAAIAMAGTALNALRVSRTGALSNWKGLAYPYAAFAATSAVYLARHRLTGPTAVFEGKKGFMEVIAGPFEIDWGHEDLERVTRTIVKQFNAEVHSQSAIEGILELRATHRFDPQRVAAIDVDIFEVAHLIIGGGAEGNKTDVRTKEEADHSLPYLLAVAVLDGQVMPEQFRPERIARDDVQRLLRKVTIRPRDDLSRAFPGEMRCHISVQLGDGRVEIDKRDYEGFHTRPIGWHAVGQKLDRLGAAALPRQLRRRIADVVSNLREHPAAELAALLRRARVPKAEG